MKFLVLIISLGLAFAATEKTLSEENLETITRFLDDSQKEQIERLETYVPTQMVEQRKPCYKDSQCPNTQVCIDMPNVLFDVLKSRRALAAYDFIRQVTGVEQGECVNDFQEFLANNASAMAPVLESTINHFNQFANRTKLEKEITSLELFGDTTFEIINTPVARSGAVGGMGGLGDSNSLMMFFFFQSLISGDDSEDSDILTYLLLIPGLFGGSLGAGGDMMSNPLLLFALLGNGGLGDSDGILKIILLSSLFNADQGFGSIMPMVMMMSLGEDGGMEDILPFMFMMNTFTGQGGNNGIADLLPILLLSQSGDNEDGNDFIKTFLIFSLISGGQSCAGNDLLPLILLMTSANGDDEDSSDIIFIILMISMLGGGSGGLSDIFPFLLLNGGLFGGDGGDDDDSMDLGMLMMLMSLGNMGSGGLGSMLPLMMMNDGDMNMEDMLMISMLGQGGVGGQGGDVMNLMVPMLMSGETDDMSSLLPVLLLLFSSGQSSNGCFQSLGKTSQVHGINHGYHPSSTGVVTTNPAFADEGVGNFLYMIILLTALGGEDGEDGGLLDDPIGILVFLLLSGSGVAGGLLG